MHGNQRSKLGIKEVDLGSEIMDHWNVENGARKPLSGDFPAPDPPEIRRHVTEDRANLGPNILID